MDYGHFRPCGFPSTSCSGAYIRSRCSLWISGLRGFPAGLHVIFNTRNARMRCSFRNTRLRPRKVNASATRGKLYAVFHMLCVSGPSAYSGERLRSRISLASELRDGTRASVLAQSRSTLSVVLRRRRPTDHQPLKASSASTLATVA